MSLKINEIVEEVITLDTVSKKQIKEAILKSEANVIWLKITKKSKTLNKTLLEIAKEFYIFNTTVKLNFRFIFTDAFDLSNELITMNESMFSKLKKITKVNAIISKELEEIENAKRFRIASKVDKEEIQFEPVRRNLLNYTSQSLIRLALKYDGYLDGTYNTLRTDLDLNVDFQRGYVWKSEQKEKLILSLIHEIPIGNIYINVLPTKMFSDTKAMTELDNVVFDGKQRLSTIIDYLEGRFSIKYNGFRYFYDELPRNIQARITGTTLAVYETQFENINDLIDYYILINTGQSLHTQEDISHALSFKK